MGLDCQVLDSGARKLSKHTTASKYSTAYNALSYSISISSSISTSTSTSTSTNTHSGAQNTNRSSSTNAMHVTSTITARRNTDKVSSYSTKSTANAVAAKDTTAIASNEHKNTVLVQSNLAVRSGMRQQGVASELLSTCEECAKVLVFCLCHCCYDVILLTRQRLLPSTCASLLLITVLHL